MQYIYTCSARACVYVCLCIRMYMQCVYKQLNSIDKDIDMHIDVNMTIQSVCAKVLRRHVNAKLMHEHLAAKCNMAPE